MWITLHTFHEVEVSDSLTYLVGGVPNSEELTKKITEPWRVFHNGRWWLAFGPPVVGAVSDSPARQTKTYTVFRTKARPTTSMRHPIGGVWDITRPTPQMDNQSTYTSTTMKDYLANSAGHNAAIELMFDKTPRSETLAASEYVTNQQMASVPNIGDLVMRLLRDKITHKVDDMRKQGMRVELVDSPDIGSRQTNDGMEYQMHQKVRIKI